MATPFAMSLSPAPQYPGGQYPGGHFPGGHFPGGNIPGFSLPWPFGPVLLTTVPNSGPAAGGNQVTLVGLGLNGATLVKFGTATATIVGGDPLGFTLNVTAPAGTVGTTVPVSVTTPSGTSNPVSYTYTGTPVPVPPNPASILPNFGPASGSTPFIILGTNLDGATVKFGTAAAAVLATTFNVIIGLTPAGTPGNVPVAVTTTGGSANVPGGYTYIAPPPLPPVVIGTVSPNTSAAAGGGGFTIIGLNLSGATVKFGTNTAVLTSNTDTTITGTIPGGTAGTNVPVTVQTTGGSASAGSLTYLPLPVVTATVNPSTGLAAGGIPFTIQGTGLSNATVKFGTNTAVLTSNTDTTITGTVPAGAVGSVAVTVNTPGGSTSGGTYIYT